MRLSCWQEAVGGGGSMRRREVAEMDRQDTITPCCHRGQGIYAVLGEVFEAVQPVGEVGALVAD